MYEKGSLTEQPKVTQASDIPDLIQCFILHNFNRKLTSSEYPVSLKYVDIRPIFKKYDKSGKSNSRPISIPAKSDKSLSKSDIL